MRDSRLKHPEPGSYPGFIRRRRVRRWIVVVLLGVVLLRTGGDSWRDPPDRRVRPPAEVRFEARPLRLPDAKAGDVRLTGLWSLHAQDPRFGGLSSLALDGHRLIAISDSGVIVRMPRPGQASIASLAELPGGPGQPQWKANRDSESLLRDPAGRGWWVGFEQQHGLWLFDAGFSRPLAHRDFPVRSFWGNWGAEGVVAAGQDLLALVESGPQLVRLAANGSIRRAALKGQGRPADAVRLADGRVLVIARAITPRGIRSSLAWLERSADGYRMRSWARLPLGQLDNVEGVAAEVLPGGATRLWLVTDNDFSSSRKTLLMTVVLR
jgi:hypothetical protein